MASFVTSAVEKLGDLLLQEGIFLYGVRDQVIWMEGELRAMRGCLEDADAKRRKGDESLKNWVRDVLDVAYRAEDVVDTFMLQVQRRQQKRGLRGYLKRYTYTLPSYMRALHNIGVEIASIKVTVQDIAARRDRYKLVSVDETGATNPRDVDTELQRRIFHDMNDDIGDIIGFNVHSEEVVDRLLDPNITRRSVISITGMGGLGKTTLAIKVYNNPEIKVEFKTRVWVTVSENYILRELFNHMAHGALGTSMSALREMEEADVKRELRNFLKGTKYLIVMDDVWTSSLWKSIHDVLPDGSNGSRVLFTTRSEEVAHNADRDIPPFLLPLLDNEQSWELFTRRTFPTSPAFPERLEMLGRRMVKRCGGLPLAVVVLGGYLSTKGTTTTEWMQAEESMDWGTTKGVEQCMRILAMSYVDLPYHFLKCFIYVASFPEDAEISASELVRLWIAEGFIPESGRGTMEDTARSYLDELVHRSLLQVVSRSENGYVLECRIHDLLREMCLKEAEYDRFLSVSTSSGGTSASTMVESVTNSERSNISSYRRISLQNFHANDIFLPSNLRSLFLRNLTERHADFSFLKRLKLLRVLELNLHKFAELPKEIKFLSNLRYLKFHGCQGILPSFIGKLRNLQTLDINGYILGALPEEIGKLPNLRHLYMYIAVDLCPSFNSSTKLQTLNGIKCGQSWMEENLPRLKSLRQLSIDITYAAEVVSFDSLAKLISLSQLRIENQLVPTELVNIILVLSDHHHLQSLTLNGEWKTRALPESNIFPPNLVKLDLSVSRLERDPMPVLENLPNLVTLTLTDAYIGEDILCTGQGFPQLQVLYLGLEHLLEWTVEVGAFPNLKELHVNCFKLVMLPEGLQHVTSLMHITVRDHRKEFRDRLLKDIGEDWHKIKYVPNIRIIAVPRPSPATDPLYDVVRPWEIMWDRA